MGDNGCVIALQQQSFYTRCLWRATGADREEHIYMNLRARRDVESFLRMWARNIRQQGFIATALAPAPAQG